MKSFITHGNFSFIKLILLIFFLSLLVPDSKSLSLYDEYHAKSELAQGLSSNVTVIFGGTTQSYTENEEAEQVAPDAMVTNLLGDWNTVSMFFNISANADVDDELSILDNDGDAIAISFNTGQIFANGIPVGTISGDAVAKESAGISIVFNGVANDAIVEEIIQSIRYRNTGDDPGDDQRTVSVICGISEFFKPIDVNPIDDRPVITNTAITATYTENDNTFTSVFNINTLSSIEAGQNIREFVFSISNVKDGANEKLTFDGITIPITNGTSGTTPANLIIYSVSVSGNDAEITLGNITPETLKLTLNAMTYNNESENPSTDGRVFVITGLKDFGSDIFPHENTADLAGLQNSTISVVSINDDPELTDLPSGISVIEDMDSDVDVSSGVFKDVDSENENVSLCLNVTKGTLTASSAGAVTVEGSGTSSLKLTGSVSNIGGFLNDNTKIKYRSNLNYFGADVITFVANDGGNTGNGGGIDVAIATVDVNVVNVNDIPSFTVGDTVTAEQEAGLVTITEYIKDIDDGDNGVQEVFFDLTNDNNELFTVQPSISATGNLTFTPKPGMVGSTVVSVLIRDNGGVDNSGIDRSEQQTFVIVLTPIKVTMSVDPTSVTEDGGTSDISATIARPLTTPVTVNLSYEGGTLDTDYSLSANNLVIPAGNTVGKVTLTAINNFKDGANKIIKVTAGNVTNGALEGTSVFDITIEDDDVAGFTITKSLDPLALEEAGTTGATFTVKLDAEPSSDVVLNIVSGDEGEASVDLATLTFTSVNWNIEQTVTVRGVDDNIIDGPQTGNITVSMDAENSDDVFDAVTDQTVAFTTSDDDVAGFTIVKSADPLALEEAGTTEATFTVKLDAEPSSDVVLNVVSGDAGEATVDLASLTFTAANWGTAQTVTVKGVDDNIIDGLQSENITVSIDAANSDNAFNTVASQMVAFTNADDDVAGFTITMSTDPLALEETGTTEATFTVKLNAEPSSDVVLNIVSGDTGEATVDMASLTFTAANWGTEQTVTVKGADDNLIDGLQSGNISVSIDAPNSDDAFDAVTDQMVAFTTTDDDIAGFTITKSADPLALEEAGTTEATFTVKLDVEPSSNVVLNIVSGDTGEATVDMASLTFTAANWETEQTVKVKGVDDNLIDGIQSGNITVSIDSDNSDDAFDALADQVVAFTTADDDAAGFTVVKSADPLVLEEAGTTEATFTVVLDAKPSTDVVLNVVSSDTEEATADMASLTFTTDNWDTAQTVTVKGADDNLVDGQQSGNITVSIDADNSDDAFDALADQMVAFKTTDDDVAGFTIVSSTNPMELEESGTTEATFTVALDAKPFTDVVINLVSGDAGEASVDMASLTFTTDNWDTPQTVTVTGVDDNIIDDLQSGNITVSIDDSNSDDAFDALADQMVAFTTADDDVAGFTIAASANPLELEESGTTEATFTVKLDAEPSSDVVLNVVSGDIGEATVDKASLTFTAGNWDTPQTVTVTGADDNIIDGLQSGNITISVDVSNSDDLFDALADQMVAFTTADNDVAGFTITKSADPLEVNESGSTASFNVVLDAKPAYNVVLDISNSNEVDANVSKTSITFTPDNWNTAQDVVINAVDNIVVEGDKAVVITVGVNDESSEDSFDAVGDQQVNVTIIDDDKAPVVSADQIFTIQENLGNGEIIGTVAATDANPGTIFSDWEITSGNESGTFEINTTSGVLSVKDSILLDWETTTSFEIYVKVSDGTNDSQEEKITINLTDVHEMLEQSITFDAVPEMTYGDEPIDLGASSNSNLTISYVSSNPEVAIVEGNMLTIKSVGTTTITASQAGDDDYYPAQDVEQVVTVNKAALTITADDKTKVYGEDNPALTYSYEGFQYQDDTIAVEPQISTIAEKMSNGGDYPIVLTGAEDPNYEITLVDGTLSITKISQEITFNVLNSVLATVHFIEFNGVASSGLPVRYESSDPSVASVDGNKLYMNKAGSVEITAYQDGNANYTEAPSVSRTIEIQGDASASPTFKLYPVPCDTELHLDINPKAGGTAYVDIYTVAGNKVLSRKLQLPQDLTIDVSGIKAGAYFLVLRKGKYIIRKKWLKK